MASCHIPARPQNQNSLVQCTVIDPRLKEGYHPTCGEQIRLFVMGIWKPSKFIGMIKGLLYVRHANKGAPKVGDNFLDAEIITLDGNIRKLSTYMGEKPLLLNFGSWT